LLPFFLLLLVLRRHSERSEESPHFAFAVALVLAFAFALAVVSFTSSF